MISTYDDVEAKLHEVLSTALAAVDGAPPLELADPSQKDVSGAENRFRAVLAPQGVTPDDVQPIGAALYHVTARFWVALQGVQGQDAADTEMTALAATRRTLMNAMSRALAGALDADFNLGGVASFAQAEARDEDNDQQSGLPPETLLDIQIRVEFDAPTRLG